MPVANWKAGYANEVHDQLFAAGIVSGTASRRALGDTIAAVQSPAGWTLSFTPDHDASRPETKTESFDALILAEGLGLELRDPQAVNSSYWLDDNLHRDEPYVNGPVRYTIVGNGDGALTDLLRIRLRNLHREILKRVVGEDRVRRDNKSSDDPPEHMVGEPGMPEALKTKVAQIERKVTELQRLQRPTEEVSRFVGRAYCALAMANPIFPRSELRPLTRVTLLAEHPFAPSSFPINRFLVAQFLAHDRAHTTLCRGRGEDSVCTREGKVLIHHGKYELLLSHRLVHRAGSERTGSVVPTRVVLAPQTFNEAGCPRWLPPGARVPACARRLVLSPKTEDLLGNEFRLGRLRPRAAKERYAHVQLSAALAVEPAVRRLAPLTLEHDSTRDKLRITLRDLSVSPTQRFHHRSFGEGALIWFELERRVGPEAVARLRFAVARQLPTKLGDSPFDEKLRAVVRAGVSVLIVFDASSQMREGEAQDILDHIESSESGRWVAVPAFIVMVCSLGPGLDGGFLVSGKTSGQNGVSLDLNLDYA